MPICDQPGKQCRWGSGWGWVRVERGRVRVGVRVGVRVSVRVGVKVRVRVRARVRVRVSVGVGLGLGLVLGLGRIGPRCADPGQAEHAKMEQMK